MEESHGLCRADGLSPRFCRGCWPTACGDWLLIDDGIVDYEQLIDGGYWRIELFCVDYTQGFRYIGIVVMKSVHRWMVT